jgi:hypothetical protein
MDTASLSGGFSRSITLDYHVSDESMKAVDVVKHLKTVIRECLFRSIRSEELRDLKVELQNSQGATHVYEVTALFTAALAPQYQSLQALLQHAAAEASNRL